MKSIFNKRALKKLQSKTESIPFKGLEQVERVLVLFSNSNPELTPLAKLLLELFQEKGIQADTIGFVSRKLEKNEKPKAHFYYLNQLDWKGSPKKQAVQDLTNKPYDVIIDLTEEIDSPNNFILFSAKSGMRVGLNGAKEFYDLVVKKGENTDERISQDIEYYLKHITKT